MRYFHEYGFEKKKVGLECNNDNIALSHILKFQKRLGRFLGQKRPKTRKNGVLTEKKS